MSLSQTPAKASGRRYAPRDHAVIQTRRRAVLAGEGAEVLPLPTVPRALLRRDHRAGAGRVRAARPTAASRLARERVLLPRLIAPDARARDTRAARGLARRYE